MIIPTSDHQNSPEIVGDVNAKRRSSGEACGADSLHGKCGALTSWLARGGGPILRAVAPEPEVMLARSTYRMSSLEISRCGHEPG
jgi:hypothetical protein